MSFLFKILLSYACFTSCGGTRDGVDGLVDVKADTHTHTHTHEYTLSTGAKVAPSASRTKPGSNGSDPPQLTHDTLDRRDAMFPSAQSKKGVSGASFVESAAVDAEGKPAEVKVGVEVTAPTIVSTSAPSKSDSVVYQQVKVQYEVMAWNDYERFSNEGKCDYGQCHRAWSLDNPIPSCCAFCRMLYASQDYDNEKIEEHARVHARLAMADKNPVNPWPLGYPAFRKFHGLDLPLLTFPHEMYAGAYVWPVGADPFATHPIMALGFWELRNEGVIRPSPTPLPDRDELRELIGRKVTKILSHLAKLWQFCKNYAGKNATADKKRQAHADGGILRQYLDLNCAMENYASPIVENNSGHAALSSLLEQQQGKKRPILLEFLFGDSGEHKICPCPSEETPPCILSNMGCHSKTDFYDKMVHFNAGGGGHMNQRQC